MTDGIKLEYCSLLCVVEEEVFFFLLKAIQPPNCVGWSASVMLRCQDWSYWVWNFCHHELSVKILGLLQDVIEVSVQWFDTVSWGDEMTLWLSVKP